MTITILALLAALQQPQGRTVAPPSTGQQPASQASQAARQAGFDSTVGHITSIGQRVGDMRATYDLYRRAAFNETDATLLQRAGALGRSCEALAAAATAATRGLCLTCVARTIQGPLQEYRGYLPSLAGVGRRCAASMARLSRGNQAVAARALRREVRTIGARIRDGTVPYERRLHRVRVAFGWAAPEPPAPRRAN